MKIELSEKEAKKAVESWVRRKLGIKGPVEILTSGTYFKAYTVETDPKLFIYKK